ncbi:DUF4215 domain-containing protein, partial [Patescibacteria group bacterium]|nr:DUF4215 domain-containing protein [Patescibacteria group bacterium]
NSNTTVDACRTDCKNPRCGDGVKDTGEGCDDGNNVNNDDCTNACTIATCGDNIIQGIEECDDGSANSNTVADACRTNCTDHRCGDSVPDTGEACDDGNNVQTDDCINSCLFAICGDEHIWTGHEQCEQNDDCTGNNICTGCQCEATPANCGNGNREGDEECDDKNNVDTDDCTNACEEAECGDNIIWNGHENCDDGNNVNDDACTNTCEEAECGDSIVQNVTGEECDAGGTDTTTCDFDCSLPICGDNHLNTIAGEQCDDGNLTNGDGCSRICLREAICGDGIINGDETCDYYHPSAPPKCRTKSDPDPCTYCGDAILQESSTEQCDEGTYNSDTEPGVCRTNCMNPSCGDGTKDNGEECDNGDDNSDTLPNQCRTDCAEPHCGDNVEDTDEECDDGNIENGDGCDSTCKEETFDCSACYLCEITEPSPYGGYMGECDEETCLGIGTCIYEGGINGICTPDPTVCQIEEQACGKIKIEIDGAIDSLPSEPGMSTIVFEDSTISFSQGWKTLSNGTIIAPTFMNSFDPNTGTPLLNDGLVIYKKMSLGNLPINSIVKGGTMNAIITPANAGMRFYNDKIPHYLSVPFNFIGNNSRMARKINEAEIEIKAITQAGGYAGSQVRMNDEISISIDLNMAGGSPLVSPSPLKENLYGDLPGAPSFSISNISIDFDVCGSAGAIQHLLMDCGNGKPDDGEECDNGPANSNTEPDACRLDCTEYKCGDGIKDSNEQCDDGNTNDEDTCSNTCQALSCGDGITQLEYGEECDDENEINFDYCTNDCKDASCGDSIVQIVIGEECDDGNFEEGDGCTSYCSLEPGYLPVCEDTDFGINYSVNGTLRFNRTWMSDPSPIFYTDKCYFPTDDRSHPSEWLEEFYCDDGLRFANKNYECDRCCQGRCLNPDEPVPSEGCDINCPTGSRICKSGTDQACVPVNVSCCGNGWIDIGEECDDGNRINDDNCTNECMDNPICGDNNPQGDEECDDGNNVNDDECTNECKNPVCGDNILQSDEECDDGNTENYDGCSDQCNKELTMLCEGDEWIDLGTVTAPNSIGDPISSHSSVAYYKGELFVSMWTRRQVSNSSFTRGTIQRYANNNQWVPDYSKTGKMNLFTNSGSLYTYDIDTGTFYRRRKNGEEGTKWQYAGTPDLFDGSEIYDVLSTDDTFYVVRKSGGVFLYDGEDQFTKLGEDIPRIGGYFQMAMDGDTIHVSHKNIYATSIYEWNGTTWDLLPEESPPRTYTILGNSYNTAYIYNGTTFKAYVRNDRDYAEISCKSLTPVAKSQHRFRFWASLFDWAKEFLK